MTGWALGAKRAMERTIEKELDLKSKVSTQAKDRRVQVVDP